MEYPPFDLQILLIIMGVSSAIVCHIFLPHGRRISSKKVENFVEKCKNVSHGTVSGPLEHLLDLVAGELRRHRAAMGSNGSLPTAPFHQCPCSSAAEVCIPALMADLQAMVCRRLSRAAVRSADPDASRPAPPPWRWRPQGGCPPDFPHQQGCRRRNPRRRSRIPPKRGRLARAAA